MANEVRQQLENLLEMAFKVYSGEIPNGNEVPVEQRVMDFALEKLQAALYYLDSERFDSSQRSYDRLWPEMRTTFRVANGMPANSPKAKYLFALEFCRKFFASEALTLESLDDALSKSSQKTGNVADVALENIGEACLNEYAEDIKTNGDSFTCDFQNMKGITSNFYDNWAKNQMPQFQAQILSTEKGALVMSAEMIAEESESHNYFGRYYVFSTEPCYDEANFEGADDLKRGPFVMTFGAREDALEFVEKQVQNRLLVDRDDMGEEVGFQRVINTNDLLPTYCEYVAQMLQSQLGEIAEPQAVELQGILNQIQRYLRNHQAELSKKYVGELKGNAIPFATDWLSPIASPRAQRVRKNEALFKQIVQHNYPKPDPSSARVRLNEHLFPLLTSEVSPELLAKIPEKLREHGLYDRFIALALDQQLNDGNGVCSVREIEEHALTNLKSLVPLLSETLRQTDENTLARLKKAIGHHRDLSFGNGLEAFIESLEMKYNHDFELPAARQLERAAGNPELQALIYLKTMDEIDADLETNLPNHVMKPVQAGDAEKALSENLEALLKKHDLLERYAALHLPTLKLFESVQDAVETLEKTLASVEDPRALRQRYFEGLAEEDQAKVRAFSFVRQLTNAGSLAKFDEDQVTASHSSFMADLALVKMNQNQLSLLEGKLKHLLEAEEKLNAFYGAIYHVAVANNENPEGDNFGEANAFTDAMRTIQAVERLLDGPGTMGDQYPELQNLPEFSDLAAQEVPENPEAEILSRIEAELSKNGRLNAKFRAIQGYDDQGEAPLALYVRAKGESEENLLKMLEEKAKPNLELVQKLNDFYGQIYAVEAAKKPQGWDGGFGYGEREAFTDLARTVEALRRTLDPTVAEAYPQLGSLVAKATGAAFEADLKTLASLKYVDDSQILQTINNWFVGEQAPKWDAALYLANEDFEADDLRKVLAGLERYFELDDETVLDQLKSKVSRRLRNEGRWVAFHGQIYEVEKERQAEGWDPGDFNFGGNNAFNNLSRTVEALKRTFSHVTV